MVKLANLIQEPLKERLKEAVAKPKKPRLQRCRIIASSIPEVEKECKQVRYYEHKEKMNLKTIPVLFMCGDRKILSKTDALWYESMGAEVKYLSETEVKSLKL